MFSLGVFSNRWIIAGIASMIAGQLLFTYAPIMNQLFHSAPISSGAWLRIVGIGLAIYLTVGFEKWMRFGQKRILNHNRAAEHQCVSDADGLKSVSP
jgi:magnesium-transporting ATPase (P-type)